MANLTRPLTLPITFPLTQPVTGAWKRGNAGPRIVLSASTIPEDADMADVIGTLSVVNGSGSYTFSITADPDSKFDLDTDDLIVDGALDYETATSHSVTIEADNGVDDPISRVFTITVTDVEEVSLTAPIAAWFSGPDVAQALFTIQLPPGTVAGMKIKGESSLDNFSTVLETVITAINPTDLGDGEVEAFAFSPFADGLTYARFYITDASNNVISTVSNTISETIATASAPVNTVAPVISGNLQVGQTLSTTDGTWTGTATIVYTYQWKRGAGNIGSATNSTYLLTAADAGQSITCVVTGTNGAGNSTGTSNALVVDVYLLFLGHSEFTTDTTTYTVTAADLGTVAANRKIVVTTGHRDNNTGQTPTVTVAGNAATPLLTQGSGTNNETSMMIIDDVTNATGNIVATLAIAGNRMGISWYAIYGAGSSTPSDTGVDSDTTGTQLDDTLAVPAKGVGIGAVCGNAGSALTIAWTAPLTLDHTTGIESNVIHSTGSVNSSAGGNILFRGTWSGAPIGSGAVFAAWGP